LLTDQDGVCEEEDTPQLSYLHFEEMARKNTELKGNLSYLIDEVFHKPVEIQETEITELLRDCKVNLNHFVRSGQKAEVRLKRVKNLFEFVYTVQRRLSHYMEVRSGVFGEAKIEGENLSSTYPGPLRIAWKKLGLAPEQIGGSTAYFDENGNLVKILLEIEHRKSKPVPEYLQYLIGFTDFLEDDYPMININLDITPIALLFGASVEIPQGIAVPCPEARKDMMKAINPILKIERGFMEEVGNVDIKKVEDIGKKIKEIFEICSRNDMEFWRNREYFVKESFEFLDTLTILSNGKKQPLFPETLTEIRNDLKVSKHTSDVTIGRELMKKTIDAMRRYSAEFPK